MILAKKVRQFAKLGYPEMARQMGKKSLQAYLCYERSTQRTTLRDLYALESVYVGHGGTVDDFWALARSLSARP